ncbi:MAG: DedA family protein [Sphingobium sp.]|nr:DedA family protein [Sphingobium sp.]MBP6111316.1 DedA family protein [Sphingobium sp.]MBP8671173.1 DedA family protein [Sphingobium sp.]MBP9156760.1 DedA family protein [Sphingobium sp.]MCC6483005.1 DedA family protein [Sphingomonadaceae bacterium]
MLNRLYQWMLAKAAHRHADRWLFAISFMESSFFPIPPHPLLMLMCLAKPKKSLWFGFVCTIASVFGGLLGYAIGSFMFASFGAALLQALGLAEKFPAAACLLRDNAALIIVGKGATPIPFKLVTIAAGFIGVPLFTFIWASALSRAFQFMLIGVLFWKFGAPIKPFIEKYLGRLMAAFLVLVIGGFFAIGLVSGDKETKPGDKCSSAAPITVQS